jgi:hypothetical protein
MCAAAIAAFGVLAIVPGVQWLSALGPVAAGFVFAATGDGSSVPRSVFGAAGAVAASVFTLTLMAFSVLLALPVAMGWRYDFPQAGESMPLGALLISPPTVLVIYVHIGAALGAIGGAIAEMARDGVVCRAIARAR